MTEHNLTKPEIDAPMEPAPDELTIVEIVEGTGAQALPGSTVDVHYAGVEYEPGEECDAPWNRGESSNYPRQPLSLGMARGNPGYESWWPSHARLPASQGVRPCGRWTLAVWQDAHLCH